MSTLLEQALNIPRPKRGPKSVKQFPDDQCIELAIAWAEGKVSGFQVCETLKYPQQSRGSFYCWIAKYVALAMSRGILKRSS